MNVKRVFPSMLTLLTACQTVPHNDSPELLKKALTGYFDGIELKDSAKMKAVTTGDFVLFEDGAIWNSDSAFQNIRKHLPFTVKYSLGDMRVHVDEHSGDIVYTNHADFVFRDSTRKSIDWIESATFRKTEAGWKMNFLHLTERAPCYDTIRYFREHYIARTRLFKTERLNSRRVVFLGNSITEFGDWKKLTGDSTVINRGIAADNTFGVLDRLSELIARRPSKLFVEIGINDISQGIPVAVIEENIFSIVARVRERSSTTQVYVVSILPVNDNVREDYPELYGKNGMVDLLDDDLRRSAGGRGFVYVDLKRQLSDGNGDLDQRYAKQDGLHLNAGGYRVWIELLRKKKYL